MGEKKLKKKFKYQTQLNCIHSKTIHNMAKGKNNNAAKGKQTQIKRLLEWAVSNNCSIPDLYHFAYDEKKRYLL